MLVLFGGIFLHNSVLNKFSKVPISDLKISFWSENADRNFLLLGCRLLLECGQFNVQLINVFGVYPF